MLFASLYSNELSGDRTLAAGDCQLYTWENPLGKRELTWSSGETKNKKDTLVMVSHILLF